MQSSADFIKQMLEDNRKKNDETLSMWTEFAEEAVAVAAELRGALKGMLRRFGDYCFCDPPNFFCEVCAANELMERHREAAAKATP